jgi:hypothetical protein
VAEFREKSSRKLCIHSFMHSFNYIPRRCFLGFILYGSIKSQESLLEGNYTVITGVMAGE